MPITNNYILKLESQRDQALEEAARWKRLYEATKTPTETTVEGLNAEAWGKWVAYRKELGKRPYKTTQVQRWLAQYTPEEQLAIVQQSLAKEWQGLHELTKSMQLPTYGKPVPDEVYL